MNQPGTPDKQPPKVPAKVDPAVKDAVPAGKGVLPKAQTLTFSQQLFIWTMVVVVGVLFGMGGTVPFIGGAGAAMGIGEQEVIQRQRIESHLSKILKGYEQSPTGEQIRQQLRYVHVAAAHGLVPKGETVQKLLEDFLVKPAPVDAKRTQGELLKEHEDGRWAVGRKDLEIYLSEGESTGWLVSRNIVVPAIPKTVGDEIRAAAQDIELNEVVIDAARQMKEVEVKADDPDIAATYNRLKSTHFTKPASAKVTIAYADQTALEKQVQIGDAEAKAWYDAHVASEPMLTRMTSDKDNRPKSEPKPFEEAKAWIVAKLTKDKATAQGEKLASDFAESVEEKKLIDQSDNVSFIAAAKAAGLTVVETAVDDTIRANGGMLQLGAIGRMRDELRLFAQAPGFVSLHLRTDSGVWLVLRLDRIEPTGVKELKEVQDRVVLLIKAERAWKPFLAAARQAQSEAAKLGPGGLAAYFATEDGKAWKSGALVARVIEQGVPAEILIAPGETLVATGESRYPVSLTMPDRPVVLARVVDGQDDELPRLRLVQVKSLKPFGASQRPPTSYPEMMEQMQKEQALDLHNSIRQHRGRLFQLEVSKEADK